MRLTHPLSAVLASIALLAAPVAMAQSTDKAQPKASTATAAKPAPKAAAGADKAQKVDGATAVRTTPADLKKSGEKNYDGCGHGKMAASDA